MVIPHLKKLMTPLNHTIHCYTAPKKINDILKSHNTLLYCTNKQTINDIIKSHHTSLYYTYKKLMIPLNHTIIHLYTAPTNNK